MQRSAGHLIGAASGAAEALRLDIAGMNVSRGADRRFCDGTAGLGSKKMKARGPDRKLQGCTVLD
ncbi:MAG: hypothetical protein AAAB19_06530, partial [Rhizobium sp.]